MVNREGFIEFLDNKLEFEWLKSYENLMTNESRLVSKVVLVVSSFFTKKEIFSFRMG